MPEKWIEPDLKGALAMAFRMVDLNILSCGFGGSADSCWPRTTCQMDMYYDTAIDLPWNKPFLRDNEWHSVAPGFLHRQNYQKWGLIVSSTEKAIWTILILKKISRYKRRTWGMIFLTGTTVPALVLSVGMGLARQQRGPFFNYVPGRA